MRIAAPIPVPVPDELSEPFWQAASEHVLVMQKCGACGWFAYPPTNLCNNCLNTEPEFSWSPVSGHGRLKTWTVMRQAFLPGFEEEIPYIVGDVELAEQPGLRIVARLHGIEAAELSLGMSLEVTFVELEGGMTLPGFTKASA